MPTASQFSPTTTPDVSRRTKHAPNWSPPLLLTWQVTPNMSAIGELVVNVLRPVRV